jgi:sugar phosphate permease
MATADTALETQLRSWQRRTFWLLWGAYASYYLCRLNFSVAQPAILREFPSWTNAQIGSIPSTYAAAYAAGQIVNGMLSERFGPRRVMTAALLIASATNVLFSLTSSFGVMQLLWAINGWGQSAGWSLQIQVIANWHTSARRGLLIGKLATCYQAGTVAAWLLAGALCDAIGWRAAFLVPGLLLLPMAGVCFLFLRDTPEDAGLAPVRDDLPAMRPGTAAGESPRAATWKFTAEMVRLTLCNRTLWILALGFLLMNAIRYSFINWGIQYLNDFHGRSIQNSVLIAVAIPVAGAFGAIAAGWASDTLFGRRRAPVCVLMLLALAANCVALVFVPRGDWVLATVLLASAGFLIHGPDMLIAGAAIVDLSHPKAASFATGFILCVGALGAMFSGAGIGFLKDLPGGNWRLIFWVLAALPLIPAALMALLWNARPRAIGAEGVN